LHQHFQNRKKSIKKATYLGDLFHIYGGAGGNRTRVRKPSTDSSTYLAVLFKFNRISTNEQAKMKRVTLDLTLY